jgi:cation transport regulator ChaB
LRAFAFADFAVKVFDLPEEIQEQLPQRTQRTSAEFAKKPN